MHLTSVFRARSDGRLISPRFFTVAIWDLPSVEHYRIIQKEIDRVVVEFTKGKNYSENTQSEIVKRLREAHGMDLRVEAVVVDSMPTDKAGKVKKVISEISSGRQQGR